MAIGATRAGGQGEFVQELCFGAGVALLVDDLAAAELKMEAALAGCVKTVALNVGERDGLRGTRGDVLVGKKIKGAIGEHGDVMRGIDGDVDDKEQY